MALNLRVVRKGREWCLYSIEFQQKCFLNQFLNDVSESHEEDFIRLQSVFDRIADCGPLNNEDIYKPLRDDLYEMKVGVLRVVCFERNYEIFCTNGFIKSSQKTPIKEIKTAKWLRSHLLVEDAKGTVKIIED